MKTTKLIDNLLDAAVVSTAWGGLLHDAANQLKALQAKLAKVERKNESVEMQAAHYSEMLTDAEDKLAAVESASNTIQCPEHDVVCPRACFYKIIKEALK
jgi:hypothetical protein